MGQEGAAIWKASVLENYFQQFQEQNCKSVQGALFKCNEVLYPANVLIQLIYFSTGDSSSFSMRSVLKQVYVHTTVIPTWNQLQFGQVQGLVLFAAHWLIQGINAKVMSKIGFRIIRTSAY